MYDAVGARWYQHTHERQDLISIGTTRLTFTIDRSGKVNNLKVIENTANEAFAIVCLQSVQELKLQPIPEDVASTLPPEGLQQELTFILYTNEWSRVSRAPNRRDTQYDDDLHEQG